MLEILEELIFSVYNTSKNITAATLLKISLSPLGFNSEAQPKQALDLKY